MLQRVSKYVVILHNREQYLFFLGISDDEIIRQIKLGKSRVSEIKDRDLRPIYDQIRGHVQIQFKHWKNQKSLSAIC